MSHVAELRASIEQRLRQILEEVQRLEQALDALDPPRLRGELDATRRRSGAPAPTRGGAGLRRANRPDRGPEQPDAAQRALQALRAELGAGLRSSPRP